MGAGANNESSLGKKLPAKKIIAMDFSTKMLRLNQASLKIKADVSFSVPLANESVGLCFSSFLMRYLSMDDQIKLFGEIHRVLKARGHFVIADLKQNGFPHQKSQFDTELLQAILPSMGFYDVRVSRLDRDYRETLGGYEAGSYRINLGIISGIKK